MKGLSHVAMGQFYEGIKAQTKVMLNDPLPGQKASPEYLKVKYLRGKLELVSFFLNFLKCFKDLKSASLLVVMVVLEKSVYILMSWVCIIRKRYSDS